MSARFLIGDVFDRMAELEDGSFDLITCSPPFLALRDYLPEGHPDKAKEIGSEPTPAVFIDTMLALAAEWRRLLAPHGSIAIEFGDTYAGSGGAGGDYDEGGYRDGQQSFNGSASRSREDGHGGKVFRGGRRGPDKQGGGWPLDKSLCGIPHLFTWSLAYGRNLLRAPLSARELLDVFERILEDTPELSARDLIGMMRTYTEQHAERGRAESPAGLWRVRNVKAWIRTNPPVGALGDKERPATSYIAVACVARDRYFDLDAVRTANPRVDEDPGGYRMVAGKPTHDAGPRSQNSAGAPPRDWYHTVDAILDAELDARAGKTSAHSHKGDHGGRHNVNLGPYEPVTTGARGHHLRRALERAGILTTLDAYDVSPKGYAGAHYAVWPPELVRLLVDEMCPRRVCTQCGEPSRRITVDRSAFDRQPELAAHIKERREALDITSTEINGWFGYKEIAKNWERTDKHGAAIPNPDDWLILAEKLGLDRGRFDDLVLGDRRWAESMTEYVQHRSNGAKSAAHQEGPSYTHRATAIRSDLGWSDCGHNTWRPGRILDPFVGSGTTLAVATGMGREAVGIDIDERNATLAVQRCGMFLEVDGEPAEPDLSPVSPFEAEAVVVDVVESL